MKLLCEYLLLNSMNRIKLFWSTCNLLLNVILFNWLFSASTVCLLSWEWFCCYSLGYREWHWVAFVRLSIQYFFHLIIGVPVLTLVLHFMSVTHSIVTVFCSLYKHELQELFCYGHCFGFDSLQSTWLITETYIIFSWYSRPSSTWWLVVL